MIKTILRTRLNSGFILRFGSRVVVKKVVDAYVSDFRAFKVDKRADGWIEVRDTQTADLWALVRRFEALGYGALYLGFGLGRRSFAYFRPYKRIRNIEVVGRAVREINKEFPFIRLYWTAKGGSLTACIFHFRVEITDLFRFVRFLSPLPSDFNEIKGR